jgi:uridine kinase
VTETATGSERRRLLAHVAARLRVLATSGTAARTPLLVGIDGVDGAGKTRFADELAAALEAGGATTFRASVDGFHHPPAIRYRRGRGSPEGFYLDSFDLAAMRRLLLGPLQPGGDRRVVRAVYDVAREHPVTPTIELVTDDTIALVDGIFLHRPELRDDWDVSIFLAVPFRVSVGRCAARDGSDPDPAAASNRRYVEAQRRYLATMVPEERATLVIDNTDLAAPRIVNDRSSRRH